MGVPGAKDYCVDSSPLGLPPVAVCPPSPALPPEIGGKGAESAESNAG
jgi:hypothetical protein